MACIKCRHQKISCKKNPCSPCICKNFFIHKIKCIPHKSQQGGREMICIVHLIDPNAIKNHFRRLKNRNILHLLVPLNMENQIPHLSQCKLLQKIQQVPKLNSENKQETKINKRIWVCFQLRGCQCWGWRGCNTMWLSSYHGFGPNSKSNFSKEAQEVFYSKCRISSKN